MARKPAKAPSPMAKTTARLSMDIPNFQQLPWHHAAARGSAPIPPGYSAVSFTQPRPLHGSSRYTAVRSIDGAAGAEFLATYESCGLLPPDNYEDGNDDRDGDGAGAPDPPPDWQFDTSNPQRDRIQARYAALSATDEVQWVTPGAGAAPAAGSAVASSSARSRGHNKSTHLVPCRAKSVHDDEDGSDADDEASSCASGGKQAHRFSGVARRLLLALAPQPKAKARNVSRSSCGRLGDDSDGSAQGCRLGTFLLRHSSTAVGDDSEDEPMPVLRSRDSKVLYRARLGLDGRPRPKGKAAAPAAPEPGRGSDGAGGSLDGGEAVDIDTAIDIAARAFASAMSAPSVTCPDRAASQEAVALGPGAAEAGETAKAQSPHLRGVFRRRQVRFASVPGSTDRSFNSRRHTFTVLEQLQAKIASYTSGSSGRKSAGQVETGAELPCAAAAYRTQSSGGASSSAGGPPEGQSGFRKKLLVARTRSFRVRPVA